MDNSLKQSTVDKSKLLPIFLSIILLTSFFFISLPVIVVIVFSIIALFLVYKNTEWGIWLLILQLYLFRVTFQLGFVSITLTSVILGASFVFFLVRCAREWHSTRRKWTHIDLFLILFVLLLVFTLLRFLTEFSPQTFNYPVRVLIKSVFESILAYYLIYFLAARRGFVERTIKTFTITASAAAIISLLVFASRYSKAIEIHKNALELFKYNSFSIRFALEGGLVPLHEGVLLIMISLPLTISLILNSKNNREKTMLGFVTVLASMDIFFSFSRTIWITYFASMAMFIYLIRKTHKVEKTIKTIACLIPIALVIFALMSLHPKIQFGLPKPRPTINIRTLIPRLNMWTDVLRDFKRAPLFGHGFNYLTSIGQKYTHLRLVHSDFFQTLAYFGLAGVFLLGGILLTTIDSALKGLKKAKNEKTRITIAAVFTSLMSLIMVGLMHNPFYSLSMPFFFIFTGLLLSKKWQTEDHDALEERETQHPSDLNDTVSRIIRAKLKKVGAVVEDSFLCALIFKTYGVITRVGIERDKNNERRQNNKQ